MTIAVDSKRFKIAASAVGAASLLVAGAVAPAGAAEAPVAAANSPVATAQGAYPVITYTPFEHGVHVTHDFLGTHTVHNGIYAQWSTNHTVTARGVSTVSELIPTTNETPVGKGLVQAFGLSDQGRGYYFWSETTGAHFVDADTAVGQFYLSNGGPEELGFPVGDVAVFGTMSVLPTEYGVFTGTFINGEVVTDFVPNPASS